MVNPIRTTIDMLPDDHDHLLSHARTLFPDCMIGIVYDNEVIHIDVGARRFTFEIGSDDDTYVFSDGQDTFVIPLWENPDANWD